MLSKFRKSLAKADPHLAKEWHPTKNGDLRPDQVGMASAKRVWWAGACGHEWIAPVRNRHNGSGCPYCAGKLIDPKRSLLAKYPDIAQFWDQAKNVPLTPRDVLPQSNRKVWWLCTQGHSHEARVADKVKRNCCPVCTGRQIVPQNSLAGRFPKLMTEWHPSRNKGIDPEVLSPSTHQKVWWICTEGHEWAATVASRSRGAGCPYCKGMLPTAESNLAVANPSTAAEWHPTKNGTKKPADFTPSSHHKAWWQCRFGHEWQSSIAHRNRGAGCPFCGGGTSAWEARVYAELRSIYPATVWHTRQYPVEVDIYIPQFHIGIEVDGYNWHKDKHDEDKRKNDKLAELGVRLIRLRQAPLDAIDQIDILYSGKEPDLPVMQELIRTIERLAKNTENHEQAEAYCRRDTFAAESGYAKIVANLPSPPKEASFAAIYPDLAKQWHPTKNVPLLPEHFAPKANRKVWWRCEKGHEWETTLEVRARGVGCPYCSNKAVNDENSLAAQYPELAAQWHPTKNKDVSPGDVVPGSSKTVWWRCENGHEWKAKIGSRTLGRGCPYCSGNKTGPDNSLAALFPEIATTWAYEKNGDVSPNDVTPGSGREIWWRCQTCGEMWQTTVQRRIKSKFGCHKCSRRGASNSTAARKPHPGRSLLDTAPEIARYWDSSKNDGLTPADVSRHRTREASWLCSTCGGRWRVSPHMFRGCPYCAGKKKMESD